MSDDIQDVLKELQKNYLASIPEKIEAIDADWHACQWKSLKSDFHKLKGTGRTYGLPEITRIGESVEQIVASDDKSQIDAAIPLALKLLHAVAVQRSTGRELAIETEPDFLRILHILSLVPPHA